MLHTIKNPPEHFNALFLSDSEYLITSIPCLSVNPSSRKLEKTTLHLSTRTISIEPLDPTSPLLQIKLNESPLIRSYTIEDISSHSSKYIPDITPKDQQPLSSPTNPSQQPTNPSKHGYLSKNAIIRKFSLIQTNNTKYINSINTSQPSINNDNTNTPDNNNAQSPKANIVKPNNTLLFPYTNFYDAMTRILNDTYYRSSTTTNQKNTTNKDIITRVGSIPIYQTSTNISNTKHHLNDLVHYLNETNINTYAFFELIKHIKHTYIVNSDTSMKYEFILLTATKYTTIPRHTIAMYDFNIVPKTFFFIIEGTSQQIYEFNEDKRYILENIHKNIFDDTKDINYIIYKKVSETYDTYVVGKFINDDEEIIMKKKAIRIIPECIQHGVVVISKNHMNYYLTYVPVINNFKRKCMKIQLSKIEAVIPYRYIYKMKAIHIKLYQSQRSKLFSFQTEDDYKDIEQLIITHSPNIDKNYTNVHLHTDLWAKGLITNYDYLIYLNTLASRSFNDLSQYPIFPWIITNYDDNDDFDICEEKNYRDLSKPIGALNRDKLAKFTEKYLNDKTNYSTNEPPYLYPIHYSSPLIVMFYLNRKLPRFQLQLQNGIFECRMLESIHAFWDYLYSDGNDVMELIPEFYSGDGDFLLNIYNLSYGRPRHSSIKRTMSDVQLPQWAKTPRDFIRINRNALESDYVSNTLNNWIDLIFGYKQRGEMAEMHENLYRPSTYEDYNYDTFSDSKKHAEIVNICMNGQTPRQLFLCPHPKKKSVDVLNYELQLNPQEVIVTLQKYKKENEALENNYKKMLQTKYEENEMIINAHKEEEKKKIEKIETLKQLIQEKECYYKGVIDKMIEQNLQLKLQFEMYDKNKDIVINEYINSVECKYKDDIKNKYSSTEKIFNYIKELESKINGYKIKEKDYKEKIEQQTKEIEKAEKVNTQLKQTLEKLDKKITMANTIMNGSSIKCKGNKNEIQQDNKDDNGNNGNNNAHTTTYRKITISKHNNKHK